MAEERKRSFIGTRSRAVTSESNRITPTVKTTPTISEEDNGVTIEQGLTLFVRAKETEQVRPATIKNYVTHTNYLADYLTEVKGLSNPWLSDLTPQSIRDYIHYMLYDRVRYKNQIGRQDKTIGLSPHTVNMRLKTLRTMTNFWQLEGIIESDVMQNIKPLLIDEPEDILGLSNGEIDVVLNSYDTTQFADYRDKILTYLLLDTGLRINEAVSLTAARIDFRLLTVLVPSQVAKNRRNREVPLSREVAKLLRELYEESVEYFGETDTIFFNAYGDPYTADAFRKRLNRRKAKLGMKRLSPHMFRHTFGRNFILNGGDIATLQRILDHADIETTRKYITVDNADIKAQHNRYSPIRRVLSRK